MPAYGKVGSRSKESTDSADPVVRYGFIAGLIVMAVLVFIVVRSNSRTAVPTGNMQINQQAIVSEDSYMSGEKVTSDITSRCLPKETIRSCDCCSEKKCWIKRPSCKHYLAKELYPQGWTFGSLRQCGWFPPC